ncbi:hypothetical protein B5807_03185 [Epicoccum nigrum]|uniref:Uncharacterized protein n=1 Tax=Epicoccum nigrum TaxID=105696 RepID=A0A1Y2M5E7_EPING|nr:hypothetical protein B5807_03185 [Epicoccum nigrum]
MVGRRMDFGHGPAVVVRVHGLCDLVVELLEVEVALVGDGDAVADDVERAVEGVRVADRVEAVAQIDGRVVDALDDLAVHAEAGQLDLEPDDVALGDVGVGHVLDGHGLAVRRAGLHVLALRAAGQGLEDLGGPRAVLGLKAGVGDAVAVAVEAYGAVERRLSPCPAHADVRARPGVACARVDGILGPVLGDAAQDLDFVVHAPLARDHVTAPHAPALLLAHDGGAIVEVEPLVRVLVAHARAVRAAVGLAVVLLVAEQRVCDAVGVLVALLVPRVVLWLAELRHTIGPRPRRVEGGRLVREEDAVARGVVVGGSGLGDRVSHGRVGGGALLLLRLGVTTGRVCARVSRRLALLERLALLSTLAFAWGDART